MSEQQIEVRQDLLPAISPRLQEQGITIREINGYRTLGIPPALRETHNIIFPTVELTQQHPDFWPTIREVRLTAAMDAYDKASHHKQGELSPNKLALYKLAEAAKVDIKTVRIPSTHLGPTERCGWTAIATHRHSDGTLVTLESSATFDNEAERLQIQAQGTQATIENRWRTKIQKASELTETIAIERAIRGILKLPHKMTKTDFEKPWLVVCYSFIPTSDEGRAAAAIGMARFYGGGEDGPVVGAGDASLPAGPSSSPALEAPVVEATPPPADDEEPAIAADDSGEVLEGVIENDPELDALVARAQTAKPPIGTYQEKTLTQILELRPGSDKWLTWAAAKDWSGADEDFGRLLEAFLTKHAPELLPTREEA